MDDQQPEEQTPEINETKPPETSEPEARAFSTDVIRAPREKKSRKKLIALLLVLFLLAGGAAAYFLVLKDKDQATETAPSNQQTQNAVQPQPESGSKKQFALATNKGQIYKVEDDGSVLLVEDRKDKAYIPNFSSPDGTYLHKSSDDGVYIKKIADKDYKKVFSTDPKAVDSTSIYWLPDESGFIVITSKDKAKKIPGAIQHIPKMYEVVYSMKVDGSEIKKLFEKTTIYGGIYVDAVSLKRDEFYWTESGEGGARSFNTTRLSDGKLLKTYDDTLLYDRAETVGDYFVYEAEDTDTGKTVLKRMHKSTGNSDIIYSIESLSDDLAPGTDDCSAGQTFASYEPYIMSGDRLFFGVVDNRTISMTLYTSKLDGSDVQEVYKEDGVRDMQFLLDDADKLLVSRGGDAICSASKEEFNPNDPYQYFIFDIQTKSLKEVKLPENTEVYAYGFIAR